MEPLTHKGTVTLETERLILRRFTVEDADVMFRNWASDPEVARYTTWEPHPDAAFTRTLLSMWVAGYAEASVYNWCITLKESGEPIGSIGTVGMAEAHLSVEVGYCVSRAMWGKGVMPEALRAVMAFLFNEVQVNRIAAKHDIRNAKSGRVMEKCGMQYEGTMREIMFTKGEFATGKLYAIVKSDIL